MGLNRLPKEGISYDDMRPLHELWKGYITDLVDFDKVKPKVDEQLQVKYCAEQKNSVSVAAGAVATSRTVFLLNRVEVYKCRTIN